MKRTDFYNIVETSIGDTKYRELDFMDNTLSGFEMKHTPGYYRVVGSDLKRLYLISYRVYNDVNFWWIIALVNGIEDPLQDLQVGQLLTIPNILDVYDFQKKFRVRRTQ